MDIKSEGTNSKVYWFVGAAYGGTDDQTQRFIEEGVWENGYEDKYLDKVKSIQPGDRIAIKASYTRKNGLPFDNRGYSVSTMAIKAVGTVTKNMGNGRKIEVDWTPVKGTREWYFYTSLKTIWRIVPGEWTADALIRFTFENEHQDIKEFRNRPFWAGRFGDQQDKEERFKWSRFYVAMADKLLEYRNDRTKLVATAHDIVTRILGSSYLQDHFSDGSSGPMKDICPFT